MGPEAGNGKAAISSWQPTQRRAKKKIAAILSTNMLKRNIYKHNIEREYIKSFFFSPPQQASFLHC